MKNVLPGLIVSILLLIFSNSCRKNKLEQESIATQKVEIECNKGWVLSVQSDGSAYLNYSRVSNCAVRLSSGTFPFQKLKLLPAFAPTEQEQYPFRWTYTGLEKREHRQYGLSDTSWAVQWFEQAYQALGQHESTSLQHKRLRKHWRTTPPTGIASSQLKNTGSL